MNLDHEALQKTEISLSLQSVRKPLKKTFTANSINMGKHHPQAFRMLERCTLRVKHKEALLPWRD